MAESAKSYTCSSPGCNMSFTDEDHLTVHRKKHDMVLNLGSNGKSTIFVADQTPTPTRFIRNCEEVGLFQDLQNVNPFEETFRRAVEAGNTGSLIPPEAGITDDTLHTPHIFPHIADVLSANSQIIDEANVDVCSSTITVTEKTNEEKNSVDSDDCTNVKLTTVDSQNIIKDDENVHSKDDSIVGEENSDKDIHTSVQSKVVSSQTSSQLSINGQEVQLLLKTADGKLMQLTAIPVSEPANTNTMTHQVKQQTVVIKTEPSLRSAKSDVTKPMIPKLSLVKMKLKQVLTRSAYSCNQNHCETTRAEATTTQKNQRKNVEQHKKKEMQERNRASSMRARAKRKAWIQQLERTVTNVNETNVALHMEVKALRAEVAKLKTLLLAHKDCPITKAMQKGHGIILGPKIISLQPELTTVPVSIDTPAKRSAPTNFTSNSKKKLAPMKNPIIFPKVDSSTVKALSQSTVVKNLPTIKIMGVSHFVTEKDETKMLIAQNTTRKVGDSSPRQIIQINPNYELEHAASKTAGA